VYRPTALIFFAALAAAGFAQSALLKFDAPGSRKAWIAAEPAAAPSDAKSGTEATLELETKGHPTAEKIYVLDTDTGNLAVVPLTGGVVKAADFKLIGQTDIKVTYGGQPLAAAMVAAVATNGKFGQMLDPTTSGTVSFYALAPGLLKVTVNYRSGGATETPVRQEFDLALTRKDPIPTFNVSVPEQAEVVGAAAGTKTNAAQTDVPKGEKPISTGSPFGNILNMLLGLGVIAGITYVVYQYVQKNPDLVGSKLEQLGVQIPKPGDAALTTADPIPAPAPVPVPVQKIVLDPVAPDPIAPIHVSTPAASPAITGVPKLIASNGDPVLLPPGSTVVGREVGLGLSILDETTISRRHAELSRQGDTITVSDLGSTNGTYVNGVKLTSAVILRPGDQVQFGAVRFRYEG
jgi:hypothetical protein